MPLAYHVIWGCYGFWLPNDPRGSGSGYVRSAALYEAAGPGTKVHTGRSVAHRPHDAAQRQAGKDALRHEPVVLTGVQARAVARSFEALPVPLHALAVMPDHVHAVLGPTRVTIEQAVRQMKQAGTVAVRAHGFPADRSPWQRLCWKVFLDTDAQVRSAIRYVEENPVRAGYQPQRWPGVRPWGPSRA